MIWSIEDKERLSRVETKLDMIMKDWENRAEVSRKVAERLTRIEARVRHIEDTLPNFEEEVEQGRESRAIKRAEKQNSRDDIAKVVMIAAIVSTGIALLSEAIGGNYEGKLSENPTVDSGP